MTNKTFSRDQKIAICEAFSRLAANVDKYKSLTPAAKDAGIEGCGVPVSYYALREQWIKEDPELADLIQTGLLARAEAYVEKSEEELEAVESKIKVYYDTWVATGGQCREMMTIINQSRFKVERWERWAGKLAPEVYGDYYYEVKEMQKKIKAIEDKIGAMAP